MSKQEIWELFYGADTAIRGRNILAVLVAALIIGFVIFITYRVTHLSTAYSAKINATNVAITLITAVIMLMISSNIVISLGMVGALSIIRFRTAIKDPWDTVYIFWAVVEGLAIGSQNFKLSFIAVVFIGMALILLAVIPPYFIDIYLWYDAPRKQSLKKFRQSSPHSTSTASSVQQTVLPPQLS